ncbi:ATP-binding protein [Desulfobulbus sp.]|uniref:ATP-binding protein n=1 Tax=Desulfobulbus sp. TaxID=895 RepID=UPI00286EE4A3|nr:ATP-binding protein [Desulfobulbus sp.]
MNDAIDTSRTTPGATSDTGLTVLPQCLSPDQWKHIFNGIELPCLLVQPNGIIIEANEATLKAARKSRHEVIGRGVCQIIHGGRWPHLPCPLEEFLKNCAMKVEETRLPGLHGEYLFSIMPIKGADETIDMILLTARELSSDEIRKVDYMRNSKLAAIGELAAGVAHEINNPITGIINFAQILLDSYKFDSAGIEMIQKIIEEGERIASITRHLISFAREDISVREPVNPAEIIYSSLALVSHQLKRDGIILATHICNDTTLIDADFKKLQQVMLNLISNSRYALNRRHPGASSGKVLEISCNYANNDEGIRVCRIVVKDYGTGLPQSLLEHIFEPFFSTKPPGEGTGLGLSISYGIIKEHGGNMSVNSIMEQFTEMIIDLPVGMRADG